MEQDNDTPIVVRDRRQAHQFSIHNRLIDEWFPILGQTGFALYCLYCRMASARDESCYPGYGTIQARLGLSRRTIASYNKLLAWSGLVYIDPGEGGRHNTYYVLDVPQLTTELLERIGRCLQADVPTSADARFNHMIAGRVAAWKPLALRPRRPVQVIHPPCRDAPSCASTPPPPAGPWSPDGNSAPSSCRDARSCVSTSPPSGVHGTPDGVLPTPASVLSTPGSVPGTPASVPSTPGGVPGTPDQSKSTIPINNPNQGSSSTAEPDEEVLALMDDLMLLVDGLKREQAARLVVEQGIAASRHLLALTLNHARENQAGYLLACARSGTRIPYAPEEIERTIRRAREMRLPTGPPLSETETRFFSKTWFLGPPEQASEQDPWAHVWAPALADLQAMNRGIAEALVSSRLGGIDDDGMAVVLVRDGHTAGNERLRNVIARTLAAVARGKGIAVKGCRLQAAG